MGVCKIQGVGGVVKLRKKEIFGVKGNLKKKKI
jgi:hypothetical protein